MTSKLLGVVKRLEGKTREERRAILVELLRKRRIPFVKEEFGTGGFHLFDE